ncbi:hypothetical protein Pint_23923 [Pistacia integerrima]|uniref:Uncharacterized protein n=1 Tax=Pistacia integerrima TaxID=434235 RepID=A0ACC0YPR5_9ROSI|nr:hypothetical protein Pint_23923 [Pistacia integerrima]
MSEEKVVCVTGASGYIASWLVKLLLERGYSVKATVRDPDLLEEGSFDSAIDGCEGVFHTASPVVLSPNDPQAELIDPAVKGTLNVLNGTPLNPDVVVDETWFSNPALCKESKSWYALSKTLAEEAAWKFAKENGIDLVTLHPGVVIGPFLQPTLNLSVEGILMAISGAEALSSPYKLVDVRDVAYALIQALEVPTATGRYLLVGSVTHRTEILKMLHKHYPTLPLSEEEDKKQTTQQFSKERAKSLGINFMPWEVSLRDTMETLKEKGFIDL